MDIKTILCILAVVYVLFEHFYIQHTIQKIKKELKKKMKGYIHTSHLELERQIDTLKIKKVEKPRGRSSKKRRKVSKRSVS